MSRRPRLTGKVQLHRCRQRGRSARRSSCLYEVVSALTSAINYKTPTDCSREWGGVDLLGAFVRVRIVGDGFAVDETGLVSALIGLAFEVPSEGLTASAEG